MRLRPIPVLGVIAVAAIALWPFIHHADSAPAGPHVVPAAQFTMAPVTRDYLIRDRLVAFYERRVKADPRDQISLNALSSQYLQRYRESGDIGDVTRAEATARKSLEALPEGNTGAVYALSSALLTLHRFTDALAVLDRVHVSGGAASADLSARKAGLEMELGRYDTARRLLDGIAPSTYENASVDTVKARYAELTGKLSDAKELLRAAQQNEDGIFDAPAQARAWYHERAGEMAFNSGDTATALADERQALALFPHFAAAWNALAKFSLASGDAKTAYDAASKGAAITPLPETVGYEADAALALGRPQEATQLRDLIFAIERIGNTYHTSDRLLAVYYAEHGVRLDDAVRIAEREVTVRGDEIYAQDTLAWADAMDGRWESARAAIAKAIRFDTEEPRLQYHAGMIALHFGDKAEAKRRLTRALSLNPHFHPRYADDARKALATL